MRSFGKSGYKSLESFGIAGVLGDEAEIFYNSLFSTQHVGRVSDLLNVCMTKAGIDEFKLRVMITFGLFQGRYGQLLTQDSLTAPASSGETLEQPITLECGVDQDKVAIGISFNLNPDYPLNIDELRDRVAKKLPANFFESMLVQFQNQSDQLVFKYLEKSRRVEIVSLLGLGRKSGSGLPIEKPAIEFVIINPGEMQRPPKPKAYIDLGDLNYTQLLREPSSVKNKAIRSRTSLVKGTSEEDQVALVQGTSADEGDEQKVAGSTSDVEEEFRISGSGENIEDELIRIEGYGELGQNDPVIRDEDRRRRSGSRSAIRSVINGTRTAISGLLGQVWPFKKKDLDADEQQFETAELISSVSKPLGNSEPFSSSTPSELGALIDQLLANGADPGLNQAQEQLSLIQQKISDADAAKWVQELVAAVAKERSRLSVTSKKLAQSLEKKEVGFERQAKLYQEELRRKDDQISQQESALERSKEQVVQLNRHLERTKGVSTGGSEDTHFRQKFSLVQKMLLSSKKEAAQLAQKVEELRNQLAATQVTSRSQGPSINEYAALQGKYDRVLKQAEEFKKANRQLIEHINEPKRGTDASASAEELRHRLDAAVKLAGVSKKESESLRNRVAIFQKQELNLKREVNRLQSEVRRLSSANRNEGGSVPPAAA